MSVKNLACNSEPVTYSPTPNFTSSGAFCHAVWVRNVKFDQFGNIWGLLYLLNQSRWNLAHDSKHTVCSHMPNFTMISAPCHHSKAPNCKRADIWFVLLPYLYKGSCSATGCPWHMVTPKNPSDPVYRTCYQRFCQADYTGWPRVSILIKQDGSASLATWHVQISGRIIIELSVRPPSLK